MFSFVSKNIILCYFFCILCCLPYVQAMETATEAASSIVGRATAVAVISSTMLNNNKKEKEKKEKKIPSLEQPTKLSKAQVDDAIN